MRNKVMQGIKFEQLKRRNLREFMRKTKKEILDARASGKEFDPKALGLEQYQKEYVQFFNDKMQGATTDENPQPRKKDAMNMEEMAR